MELLVGMLALVGAAILGATALWVIVVQDKLRLQNTQPKTIDVMLVGYWELVTLDGHEVTPEATVQLEFTQDGEFITKTSNPAIDPVPVKMGTYRLYGNTVQFVSKGEGNTPRDSWTALVESVTSDSLQLASEPWRNQGRTVYKKLKK